MKKEIPKIATIFLITVGVVVWGLNYIFLGQAPKSKAAGETVTLSFSPSSATASSGDFSTTIKAKPSVDILVRGYEFKVHFDNTKVQVKTISYKLGSVSSGIGDKENLTTVNANGYINVVGESQESVGAALSSTGETDVLTIIFTSNSASTSNITVEKTDGDFRRIDTTTFELVSTPLTDDSSSVVNGTAVTNTPVPTTLPGEPTNTPVPTGTTGNVKLNLKLKFQGITGLPDGDKTMTVTAKLLKDGTGNQPVVGTGIFTADTHGIWSGTIGFDIIDVAGKYFLLLSGDKSMARKLCESAPTETTPGIYHCSTANIALATGDNNFDLSKVVILAGDLNQDDIVDSVDFSTVKNLLGKTDADSNKKADINHDGRVDTQDVSLIIIALSFKLGDTF